MTIRFKDVNPGQLEQLQGKVMGDVAGSLGLLMAYIGDKLDLYSALLEISPATSQELAETTGMDERYLREWLSANAAAGYVNFDGAMGKFSISPEQAVIFAAEGHPACMQGFFQAVMSVYIDEPKLTEVFRSGKGLPWSDHSPCLFCGTERFFRPMYAMNLLDAWIPSLTGVKEKLEAGARVADIGCGHGSSTIIMAQAFPNSTFHGFDFHEPSVEHARERARAAGVASNTIFEVVKAKAYPGKNYDLVTVFDALHDMGDPVGAAQHIASTLAKDGSLMLVEPFAGDSLEENLHPLGQIYYSFSTMVCVPASKSQEVGLGLGAQAGQKKLTEVLNAGGFSQVRRAAETATNLVLEAKV
ncbi:MAG: class I SAM-dependent methyltransferase [Methylomonas sp.]|jgi:ubiquinone/menaquinone biosynthesis C-methylase UbiE|uniref:class I SAM-dependent methyltransferase n=1 Tax=Methylomonas sp. TaxID=418 RepID=UPI002600379A|nr:class I SAM-dependent methyltransferase [Methylomonas sp.]MCK9605687.1 class I SAM-dependent methyltransferase [Methylomonas sp.]